MRPTKARDIMTDTVVALKPEMTLSAAWEVLFESKISGAPVIDRTQNVVGVLSQNDLVRETFSEGISDFPKNTFYLDMPFYAYAGDGWKNLVDRLSSITVSEAMTKDPVCVSVEDSISYLARTMRSKHIHRLIVTDNGKLMGVVSSLDLLKVLELQ